ncbi:acid protease [Suillus discolor]|uniref:Acid protease n=1 Tax=Suillus discolor TaxID=1912936 RepID=A0A9P7EYG4_9AGAM|nr:acid protease [Suillus discolor]KAG2098285.1 acid protease [Suillus discolor]
MDCRPHHSCNQAETSLIVMRSFSAFLCAVLIAASRSTSWASVTIPLTKIELTGSYLQGSPHADRALVSFLETTSGPKTVPATSMGYQYTVKVGVGSPATYYDLIIDTGSSNTFVGTGKKYVRTSTSVPTGQNVSITYTVGFFNGTEYYDTVTLAPGFAITNQSIGDGVKFTTFDGVDGLLGIGPADLTQHTLIPDTGLVPTVMDNALKQGLIKHQIFGISFAPAKTSSDTNGAITYGGIDPAFYIGDITYTPITKTSRSSLFWGINVTQATYGAHSVIPQSTAGIVDSGTTKVYLADDFFSRYVQAIPGAYYDVNKTGLVVIPISSVGGMQPLNFTINARAFSLDTAAQLIPLDEYAIFGLETGVRYSIIKTLGRNSGRGLDFVLGMKFMEKFYVVFDADNSRVGFAYTNHTFTRNTPVAERELRITGE